MDAAKCIDATFACWDLDPWKGRAIHQIFDSPIPSPDTLQSERPSLSVLPL